MKPKLHARVCIAHNCFQFRMGANSSSFSELSTNDQLRHLAGTDSITPNDPFWNQLLSFSFSPPRNRWGCGSICGYTNDILWLTSIFLYASCTVDLPFLSHVSFFSADQRLLEESTASICKNFAINNCRTGNFSALIRVFLTRAAELKASAQCEE